MRTDEARLLLGVTADASMDEAKSAYLRRAKLLHPDKHQDPAAHAEAEAAMSQLNQAWQTLQAPPPESRNNATTASPQVVLRGPTGNECSLCGFFPATPVSLRVNVGKLIWYTRHSMDLVLCRDCGRAMAREAQADTMTKGWWGPISALVNLINIAMNMGAMRRLTELATIRPHRDPAVVTPLGGPMPSRPLTSRPLPWLATIAFVVIATALSVNAIKAANKDAYVGNCYAQGGTGVSCSSTQAVAKVVQHLAAGSSCPPGEASDILSDNTVVCLVAVTN